MESSQTRSMPLRIVEQGVIATYGVMEQALVGLQHVALWAGLVERELKAQRVELHTRSWSLAVEGQGELGRVGEIERQVDGSQGTGA